MPCLQRACLLMRTTVERRLGPSSTPAPRDSSLSQGAHRWDPTRIIRETVPMWVTHFRSACKLEISSTSHPAVDAEEEVTVNIYSQAFLETRNHTVHFGLKLPPIGLQVRKTALIRQKPHR